MAGVTEKKNENYGEVAAKVFKLFLQGKTPAEVVVELQFEPEIVKRLHNEFCELNDMKFELSKDAAEYLVSSILNYEIDGLTLREFGERVTSSALKVERKLKEVEELEERLSSYLQRHLELSKKVKAMDEEYRRRFEEIEREIYYLKNRRGIRSISNRN